MTEKRQPARQDVDTAEDCDWALAAVRAKILAPLALQERVRMQDIEQAAKKLYLSVAMTYRLLGRYRKDPHTSSLLADRRGRKLGSQLLAKPVEDRIDRAIKTYFSTPERPSVAALHRMIVAECRKAMLTAPSYKAVRARVTSFDVKELTRKRLGPKTARDRFQPVSARGPRPERPLQLIQIDHTLVDIIIVDEVDRLPIGRPWLSLAIDVATRMIAGYYVSFDHPSSTSVALAISHAVLPKNKYLRDLGIDAEWPVTGLPETIHLDNAKEFHARALERGCQEHGIRLEYRPPLRPNFGGHVERLIGTLMGAVHLLPGTTFSSTKERGDYDSQKHAVMTLSEFEIWLAMQVTGVYHQSFHRGLGCKPISFWNQRFAAGGPRQPVDSERFYLDFLPFEQRRIRRDGIQLFRIHYWDNILSPMAGRSDRAFVIRYDPRDLSKVFVKGVGGDDGYVIVPYRDLARPSITLMEHRAAMKALAKDQQLTLTENNVFNTIAAQRILIEKAKQKTNSARRKIAGSPVSLSSTHQILQTGTPKVDQYAASTDPVSPYEMEVWDE